MTNTSLPRPSGKVVPFAKIETFDQAVDYALGGYHAAVAKSEHSNGPVQRQYPSLAYDSKRGKVMLFGGYTSADGLVKQDTWEWSGTDANWVPRTNANAKPPGRQQGSMVYDSKRDQLLLWGGSGTGVTNWHPKSRTCDICSMISFRRFHASNRR